MSCAKLADPTEMGFDMPSRVGSREHVLHGNVDAPREWALFGVCGQLKSIVKDRGMGKRVNCAKNGQTHLNYLYVMFLRK